MALPGKAFELVKAMSAKERTDYFENYARYTDSPTRPYAIRVGSRSLHSADTYDLRKQFDKLLAEGEEQCKSSKRTRQPRRYAK